PEASYITFTFEDLDISPEDHLEFYDISTSPNELLDSYTGNDNPGVVTYYQNKIQVLFIADNYLNASGFKLYWSTDAAGVEDFGVPVSVYPNPASSILHVSLPDANDGCVATIYNMVGQAVFTQTYDGGQPIAIPVNGFVNGMYLLELESDGRVLHQKIMVKH
ncbi:MAG: T9SS type A sorting domain-containing protein, partial [Bacteroidales bacterium]|nr:T9SS type A sorting domain-containing protein [Bacteroidales bacterium]